MKNINEMSVDDFEKVPKREYNEDVGSFDRVAINYFILEYLNVFERGDNTDRKHLMFIIDRIFLRMHFGAYELSELKELTDKITNAYNLGKE